jgi:hypothetical protein
MCTSYPFNIPKSCRPKVKQSTYFRRNPVLPPLPFHLQGQLSVSMYPWLLPPCFPLEQPSHFLVAIGCRVKKAHPPLVQPYQRARALPGSTSNFFHLVSCVFFEKHLLNILLQIHLDAPTSYSVHDAQDLEPCLSRNFPLHPINPMDELWRPARPQPPCWSV